MMDWSESPSRRGAIHEWGVRWDITNSLCGTSRIVTHVYRKMSDPFEGPSVCVESGRVVIALAHDEHSGDPWACRVVYLYEEALHPATVGDPSWTTVSTHSSHDTALAALEAEARRLGWNG